MILRIYNDFLTDIDSEIDRLNAIITDITLVLYTWMMVVYTFKRMK